MKFSVQLCTWLRSYLSNQIQKTFANNITSSSLPVVYGAPQGSVFNPLLFILYLNDAVDCVQKCKYFLYADDIVLYKDIDSVFKPTDTEDVQSDFSRIERWCRVNELTINV